jgi:hypothetical protein
MLRQKPDLPCDGTLAWRFHRRPNMGVDISLAFTTSDDLTEEGLRRLSDAIEADLGNTYFGWQMPTGGLHALMREDSVSLHDADLADAGDCLLYAAPGRIMVQVLIRSPWRTLCGTTAAVLAAEHILRACPDAEIHYGGDGVSLKPVTPEELWAEVHEIAEEYKLDPSDELFPGDESGLNDRLAHLGEICARTPEAFASGVMLKCLSLCGLSREWI